MKEINHCFYKICIRFDFFKERFRGEICSFKALIYENHNLNIPPCGQGNSLKAMFTIKEGGLKCHKQL